MMYRPSVLGLLWPSAEGRKRMGVGRIMYIKDNYYLFHYDVLVLYRRCSMATEDNPAWYMLVDTHT